MSADPPLCYRRNTAISQQQFTQCRTPATQSTDTYATVAARCFRVWQEAVKHMTGKRPWVKTHKCCPEHRCLVHDNIFNWTLVTKLQTNCLVQRNTTGKVIQMYAANGTQLGKYRCQSVTRVHRFGNCHQLPAIDILEANAGATVVADVWNIMPYKMAL